MEENSRLAIKAIKSRVKAMMQERNRLIQDGTVTVMSPSKYWADFCSYFDYMFGLAEESYSKLRLHTYHLTADNYQSYYFGDAKAFKEGNKLDLMVKDIPPELILNEPEGGIGFRYEGGRFVSSDTVRFQKVVNDLHRSGILSKLLAASEQSGKHILEIGAGYGGLAHHLSNIIPGVTYFIVDLPETLLFSASYLSLLHPLKKMYLYDENDLPKLPGIISSGGYDYMLLPNYRLDSLLGLKYDLVLNVASFQEMRTEQVETYLDFIGKTCTGALYSWNLDCNPRNDELSNISKLLESRFKLLELFGPEEAAARDKMKQGIRNLLISVAVSLRLAERAPLLLPDQKYRAFICEPRQGVTHIKE